MDERDGSGDAPPAVTPPRAMGRAPRCASADGRSAPMPANGRADVDGNGRHRRRGFHRSRTKGNSAPRAVDLRSLIGVVSKLPIDGRDTAERKRRLLAELCKVVGAHLSGADNVGEELKLPLRLRQTLRGLIKGDSEKQIAFSLGISQHTVHVYVKQLYKRLRVSSRGELMAKFMRGK